MAKSARLNADILRLGILAFSFSMLCLGLEESGDVIIWNWGHKLSFPAPFPLYQVLGWISLALAALLVVAALSKWVRDKLRLEDIMHDDTETDNGIIAVARYGKWLIILLVLFAGWLGFLSESPPQSLAFNVLFWFGFVLCCVVLAVPLVKARRISSTKKQQDAKKHISKWAAIKQTIERRIKWAKENRLSVRIEWQKRNTASDRPAVKPVYSWTEKQIIDIKCQLHRTDLRLERMERSAKTELVYGIGFGIVGIGIGLLVAKPALTGWIVTGIGLILMLGIALIEHRCANNSR